MFRLWGKISLNVFLVINSGRQKFEIWKQPGPLHTSTLTCFVACRGLVTFTNCCFLHSQTSPTASFVDCSSVSIACQIHISFSQSPYVEKYQWKQRQINLCNQQTDTGFHLNFKFSPILLNGTRIDWIKTTANVD